MNYSEKIEKRESVRTFEEKEVSEKKIAEIKAYFDEAMRLDPSIDVELQVFTGNAKNRLEGAAGYKGYALMAPAYLVILSEEKPHYLENAGYICEDMILKLVEMGLDNCWLSTGDAAATKRALLIESDKTVAALVAFGYGKREGDIRIDIKTPSNVVTEARKGHAAEKIAESELVYQDKWKQPVNWESGAVYKQLDEALYAASLAPSYLNIQPYRFVLRENYVLLVLDEKAAIEEKEAMLDLGAVMLNFAAVYQEKTHHGSWEFVDGTDNASDHHVTASFVI